MDSRLTNRTLAIMLVIMVFAFLASIVLASVLFQTPPWPPPVTSVVPAAIVVIVMILFIIYGARFRDERAMAISDKSTRNGFIFFIITIPSLVILSSLAPDLFSDMAVTLAVMWIGVAIVACISALYYYRK